MAKKGRAKTRKKTMKAKDLSTRRAGAVKGGRKTTIGPCDRS